MPQTVDDECSDHSHRKNLSEVANERRDLSVSKEEEGKESLRKCAYRADGDDEKASSNA